MAENTLLLVLAVAVIVGLIAVALHQPRVSAILHEQIPEHPKRRLFLAAVGFFLTFAVARTVAYTNFHKIGPFHDVYIGGRHIHHLVWGIVLLLGVGYGWLVGAGEPGSRSPMPTSLVMALLYGVGAALTLDEFALWLNLEDVYWARQGRESIDAVILFGALLLIGIWGRRFFLGLARGFIRFK